MKFLLIIKREEKVIICISKKITLAICKEKRDFFDVMILTNIDMCLVNGSSKYK